MFPIISIALASLLGILVMLAVANYRAIRGRAKLHLAAAGASVKHNNELGPEELQKPINCLLEFGALGTSQFDHFFREPYQSLIPGDWVLTLCRHAERLCSLEPSRPPNNGTCTKVEMRGVASVCQTVREGIQTGFLNTEELAKRAETKIPNTTLGSALGNFMPDSEDSRVRGFTNKLAAASVGLDMRPDTGGMEAFAYHALSWSDAVISAILNDWMGTVYMPTDEMEKQEFGLRSQWQNSVRTRICSELMRDIRLLAEERRITGRDGVKSDESVALLGSLWALGSPLMWPNHP